MTLTKTRFLCIGYSLLAILDLFLVSEAKAAHGCHEIREACAAANCTTMSPIGCRDYIIKNSTGITRTKAGYKGNIALPPSDCSGLKSDSSPKATATSSLGPTGVTLWDVAGCRGEKGLH